MEEIKKNVLNLAQITANLESAITELEVRDTIRYRYHKSPCGYSFSESTLTVYI